MDINLAPAFVSFSLDSCCFLWSTLDDFKPDSGDFTAATCASRRRKKGNKIFHLAWRCQEERGNFSILFLASRSFSCLFRESFLFCEAKRGQKEVASRVRYLAGKFFMCWYHENWASKKETFGLWGDFPLPLLAQHSFSVSFRQPTPSRSTFHSVVVVCVGSPSLDGNFIRTKLITRNFSFRFFGIADAKCFPIYLHTAGDSLTAVRLLVCRSSLCYANENHFP